MKLILLLSLKLLKVFRYAAKVIHQTAFREKFDRMFLQVSMIEDSIADALFH